MSAPEPSDEQLAELGITREQWQESHRVFCESMKRAAEFASRVSRMAYDEGILPPELGVIAALLMRSATRRTNETVQGFVDLVEAHFKFTDVTPS